MNVMGELYLAEQVACADDLPLRAAHLMRTASVIVAGDLPAARALLDECGIETPLIALPDAQTLRTLLANGNVVWLDRVFDRPHTLLADLIAQGIQPQPLPAGVDVITALVTSGLPTDRFAFYPALPTDLEPCAREPYTLLFAITPERWPTDLQRLSAALGDRRAALYHAGEMWRGHLSGVPSTLTAPAILVVEGATTPAPTWDETAVCQALRRALAEGASPRQAAQIVARQSGWPRRQVYALAVTLQQAD